MKKETIEGLAVLFLFLGAAAGASDPANAWSIGTCAVCMAISWLCIKTAERREQTARRSLLSARRARRAR